MLLRFFIILLSVIISYNASASNITADDISLSVHHSVKNYDKASNTVTGNISFNLSMPSGWYTYYKNGGDTGLGVELEYINSNDAKFAELSYNAPTKYVDSGFASYIYKDNTNFNQEFTINDKSITDFTGTFGFLICKDICIPITKEFKSKKADFINNKKTEKQNLNFTAQNSVLYIQLIKADDKNITFIPSIDGLINDTAQQHTITINNQKFLTVELDEYLKDIPNEISGFIITQNNAYKIKATKDNLDISNSSIYITEFVFAALFALIGGIILNLMPCVLPVIGLKAYSLTQSKSNKDRLKSAAFYSAGVFACMMLIVAILLYLKSTGLNLAWGFQLQNTYFIIFLIIILLALGLNFLGAISIGEKLSAKASSLNMKHSNDFLTGVLATIIGTPCTAPFMATSIGFALSSNSIITPIIIFAFLALGICLPIIIIALIPKSGKFLPKSGNWNVKVKEFLAFPIFATAVWLVWVLGNDILTNIALLAFALLFSYWLIKLKSKIKFIFIAALITVCFILSPLNKKVESADIAFNKQQIEELNSQGTTVFVDFTAKWCITCQYNKKTVLKTDKATKLFKDNNIVFMTADWTDKNDIISKELKTLGRSGVPVYAIYKNGNVTLLPEILTFNTLKQYIEKGE